MCSIKPLTDVITVEAPKTSQELERLVAEHVINQEMPEDWHPLANLEDFEALLKFCQDNCISVVITALWGDRVDTKPGNFRKIVEVEYLGANRWNSKAAATSVPEALAYALLKGVGVELY